MNKVEEQAMVTSELLRMLEDVANREIPCQVAYRDIQKRLVAAREEGVAKGAEGVMSCPLYSHGWANDDDRQGEVHCCDRKGHEMSWNPDEMRDELVAAGIDPVLAPTKEKP